MLPIRFGDAGNRRRANGEIPPDFGEVILRGFADQLGREEKRISFCNRGAGHGEHGEETLLRSSIFKRHWQGLPLEIDPLEQLAAGEAPVVGIDGMTGCKNIGNFWIVKNRQITAVKALKTTLGELTIASEPATLGRIDCADH